MFEVAIREFERGWGNRIDEIKTFDTRKEAEVFINEFNKNSNLDDAPDWYMKAEPINFNTPTVII